MISQPITILPSSIFTVESGTSAGSTVYDAPAGSLVVLDLGDQNGTGGIQSLVDSAGNVYVPIGTTPVPTFAGTLELWACLNTLFDLPVGSNFIATTAEGDWWWLGGALAVAGAGGFDQVTEGTTQTGSGLSLSSGVIPTPGEIAISALFSVSALTSFTEGDGFTTAVNPLTSAANAGLSFALNTGMSPAIWQPSWTPSQPVGGLMALFEAAGALTAPSPGAITTPPNDPRFGTTDPVWPGILTSAGSDLIYRQASGLERAMADVDAGRLIATYAELVKDQWNPYAISSRNLPFLAWAMGVNLWEDDWSDAFRRYWVANQWTLKQQRGSLAGISAFVAAVGAKVEHAITPPASFYPGAATSPDYQAAWIAKFPQLRIYPYAPRPQLPWLCYIGNLVNAEDQPVLNKNGYFLGPLRPFFPTNFDAGGTYMQDAEIWNQGVVTNLTVRQITSEDAGLETQTTYNEVVIPSSNDDHYYASQQNKFLLPAGHNLAQNKSGIFLGALDAAASLLVRVPTDGTIDLMLAKAIYTTIVPGEQPIQVAPQYVSQDNQIRFGELCCAPSYGQQAAGSIVFDNSNPPLPGDTITIGGTTVTWGLTDEPIARTMGISLGNMMNFLNASTDSNISKCSYSYGANSLNIIFNVVGEAGNGFTLACNVLGSKIGMRTAILEDQAFGVLAGGFGVSLAPPGKLSLNRSMYLNNIFLPPSNAWQFMYQMWNLFDPTLVPPYKKASTFCGQARLGINKYTAELKIAAFNTWPRCLFRCGGFLSGFMSPSNNAVTPNIANATINKVRRAVTASMAVRDTIRIDTAVMRQVQIADAVLCDGNTYVGQYIDKGTAM